MAVYRVNWICINFKQITTLKTLIIVRHAKSSWANMGQTDFERPLNNRGETDAPEMAWRLQQRFPKIDRFISSPAKRAKQTCRAFCKVYGIDKEDIVYVEKLYHAPRDIFYEVAAGLADADETVIIFSHNPGITDFVNSLCADVYLDNMPTCAVFAIQVFADHWEDFEDADRKFLYFDYPKNIS